MPFNTSICSTPFFNETSFWELNRPYPTRCFLYSIVTFPCVLIWLAFIPYLLYIYKSRRIQPIPLNGLNVSRLILAALIAGAFLFRLGKGIYETVNGENHDFITYLSPSIVSLTIVLSMILMILERRFGAMNSPLNFVFYLLMVIVSAVNVYAVIGDAVQYGQVENLYNFLMQIGLLICFVVLFILLCFADYDMETMGLNPNVCLLSRASILSQITFWWINSLVFTSYKKSLQEEDVFQLRPEDEVERNYTDFKQKSDKYERKHNRDISTRELAARQMETQDDESYTDETAPIIPSMQDEPSVEIRDGHSSHVLIVLIRVFGPTLLMSWCFKLTYDVLNFMNPQIQRLIINYTADLSQPAWHGGIYAALYVANGIFASVCFHQNFHLGLLTGMRIRSALTAAVYRKSLEISNESRGKSTVGEIVNLMSVDSQRICDCVGYLWILISSSFQIILAITLLWNELGAAVLAGVGILVFIIPFNGCLMTKVKKFEEKEMEWKDKRMKLLGEVLSGMKILKLYAWEPSYQERVAALRKTELSYARKTMIGWAISVIVWSIVPFIVTLVTFTTYVYSGPGRILTAEKAFVSLTLFNMLRFPMQMLPWGISSSINAYVSVKRLNRFFSNDDLDASASESRPQTEDGPSISIEEGTFSWTNKGYSVLRNINLKVPKGQIIGVVGKVGSGKSSLISAILGELEKRNGTVVTRGSIAYVPQQAWIQHMSVQDNILFGKSMDREWYEKVLDACALRPDLKLLSSGDQTEIGERGVNLSGGQKQRVSLARALYQHSDIYLLDDPLSAVDAHVGNHLFDEVIGATGLLAAKTRLLVTHGLQWLPSTDLVVVINDGVISEVGTYDELIARPNGELAELVRDHMNKEQTTNESEEDGELEAENFEEYSSSVESDDLNPSNILSRRFSRQRSESSGCKPRRRSTVTQPEHVKKPDPPQTEQVETETMETGHVSWSAYTLLIRGRGIILFIFTLLCYCGFTALGIGSNLWLSSWADDNVLNNRSTSGDANLRSRTNFYLGIYGVFGVGQMLMVIGFAFLEAVSNIRASYVLHHTMLHRIMRAPMSFFETTPIGRIINRFSKDMETIDHELPRNINSFFRCFLSVLASVIVISFSTPLFLGAIVPLLVVYFFIQKFFIPVSRQSRRLDSVTRSAIYTHFTESILGAPVIRAFKHTRRFFDICDSRIDTNARFFFVKVSSNRWLGFRLELLGCMIVFSAILMSVLGRNTLQAGIVGLSISYALQITDNLNWMVRQITEIETNAVAVERIQDYGSVDQEAPWEEEEKPEDDWPNAGRIRFNRYSTRYRRGLDLVLKDVSVQINPGETVGIVGRTGAGKSSLTLALFRLIEAVDGCIEVDRVNVANIGLHHVRGRLTILPQDPVLFSGNLRDNLDPFFQFSDEDVWRCLELARLSPWVRQQSEGLWHEVGEGGSNLSVGQRQLVCLTRALLRRSKVLVLDEATAAVDVETDRVIMETVREQFRDSTILIIAHRLGTIMDSDRVLVFDQGQLKQFDTPDNLLKDTDGIFYNLAEHAGIVKS